MKRVIIILLSICLFCCTYTCVFAETITEETTQQTNLAIEYAVESAYVVTIPDTITVNPSNAVHGTVDITISDVMLPKGYTVRVQLHGNSYTDGCFYLTDKNDPENQIPYAIVHDSLGAEMTPGAVVNMVEAGSGNRTETLNINLLNEAIYAGTYADIVTFDVNLWVDGRPANITADNFYGIWKLNDEMTVSYPTEWDERIDFYSNGTKWTHFGLFSSPADPMYPFEVQYCYDSSYDDEYTGDSWFEDLAKPQEILELTDKYCVFSVPEEYRLLEFYATASAPTTVSEEFFNFIIANATYQSS